MKRLTGFRVKIFPIFEGKESAVQCDELQVYTNTAFPEFTREVNLLGTMVAEKIFTRIWDELDAEKET